jgi:hypothetical protein
MSIGLCQEINDNIMDNIGVASSLQTAEQFCDRAPALTDHSHRHQRDQLVPRVGRRAELELGCRRLRHSRLAKCISVLWTTSSAGLRSRLASLALHLALGNRASRHSYLNGPFQAFHRVWVKLHILKPRRRLSVMRPFSLGGAGYGLSRARLGIRPNMC